MRRGLSVRFGGHLTERLWTARISFKVTMKGAKQVDVTGLWEMPDNFLVAFPLGARCRAQAIVVGRIRAGVEEVAVAFAAAPPYQLHNGGSLLND
jgi:hypothetical protein